MTAGAAAMVAILALWCSSTIWIRRARDSRAAFRRLATTFAIPIVGMAVLVMALQGLRAWPLLVLLVAASLAAGLAGWTAGRPGVRK